MATRKGRNNSLEEFQYAGRECGGCTACCHAVGIEELRKPYFVNCENQCESGCAVHAKPEQPDSCKRYQCLWLMGEFEPQDRPDKLGVVFHAIEDQGPWVEAFLLRPDIDKHRVQKLVIEATKIFGRIRMIRFDQVMNTGYEINAEKYPNMENVGEGCDYATSNGSMYFLQAAKRISLKVL
jgi:hypothetical protein